MTNAAGQTTQKKLPNSAASMQMKFFNLDMIAAGPDLFPGMKVRGKSYFFNYLLGMMDFLEVA